MVSLTCSTRVIDGVTLVTARLDGAAVAQRVRLANRLDGPVWPPRREGVPEAGWNEASFETVVPEDGTVAVGYASPAPSAEPPLAIVERAVVDEDDAEEPVSAASALRDLGDPSPPRDAVPIPIDASDDRGEPAGPTPDPPTTGGPDAVAEWFDAVEGRISTAEQFAAAETVPEATAALREAGSLADIEILVADLRDDADALETVARRAEDLAERADDADVPLATLERLA